MSKLFSMQPEVVETFETKYRKIITPEKEGDVVSWVDFGKRSKVGD